ncbi:MAG TPA: hypothetical protein VED19_00040, partial [Candidatus Nitrosopolaris sp.]|nr:hypothetical protein [Candidatus Nitrosopolaris sp.]
KLRHYLYRNVIFISRDVGHPVVAAFSRKPHFTLTRGRRRSADRRYEAARFKFDSGGNFSHRWRV